MSKPERSVISNKLGSDNLSIVRQVDDLVCSVFPFVASKVRICRLIGRSCLSCWLFLGPRNLVTPARASP